ARVLAEPDVQVGPAHAGRPHIHGNLARPGLPRRPLGDLDMSLPERHLRQPEHSSSSTSAAVGMSSAQPSRDATTAPAALAKRTHRSTSQPDSSPWQSALPNASPAPSPLTTSTGTGGTTQCS